MASMINESINNCDIKSGAELPKCISARDEGDESSEAEHLTPDPHMRMKVEPYPSHSKRKRSKRSRIAGGVLITPKETREEKPMPQAIIPKGQATIYSVPTKFVGDKKPSIQMGTI